MDATGLSLVLARAVERSRYEAYDELMADALPSRVDAVDLAVGFHRAVEAARQRGLAAAGSPRPSADRG